MAMEPETRNRFPRLMLAHANHQYLLGTERVRPAERRGHDELYLEIHRGTTTTKGQLKQLSRRCELTARAAQLCAVLAEPYDDRLLLSACVSPDPLIHGTFAA